jgi:hypothetical protein
MLLVDDYRIMIVVFFLNMKSYELKNFNTYKDMVKTETELKIKFLRFDNGGEFTLKEFMEFFKGHGIKRKFSVSRTPQ